MTLFFSSPYIRNSAYNHDQKKKGQPNDYERESARHSSKERSDTHHRAPRCLYSFYSAGHVSLPLQRAACPQGERSSARPAGRTRTRLSIVAVGDPSPAPAGWTCGCTRKVISITLWFGDPTKTTSVPAAGCHCHADHGRWSWRSAQAPNADAILANYPL